MIGKIFKYNDYDVYYKIDNYFKNIITPSSYIGTVIKSNDRHFMVGNQYYVYPDVSTEISEHDFNKIIVFE